MKALQILLLAGLGLAVPFVLGSPSGAVAGPDASAFALAGRAAPPAAVIRVAAPNRSTAAQMKKKAQAMQHRMKSKSRSADCEKLEKDMESAAGGGMINNAHYQENYQYWVNFNCAEKPGNSSCKDYEAEMHDAETGMNHNYSSWQTTYHQWQKECE